MKSDYYEKTIKKYGKGRPHIARNVINATNTDNYSDTPKYRSRDTDLFFTQSNLYYKDNYIKSIYTRTASGTPAHTSVRSGPDGREGDWNTIPDLEFMWAELEGKVWPYGGSLSVKK